MNPTILRIKGFRFYFFSREEPRAHVHVQHVEGEAKFWIEPAVELHANYGLKAKRLAEAEKLVRSTRMKSATRGRSTSQVEVTNVSPHGFWLFVGEQELFVPFRDFPWFREASIRQISHVERPSAHHLYWPDLDIDLAVDSLTHPDRYPLVSQAQPSPGKRWQPTKTRRGSGTGRKARARLRG